jgi:hypothetical protein
MSFWSFTLTPVYFEMHFLTKPKQKDAPSLCDFLMGLKISLNICKPKFLLVYKGWLGHPRSYGFNHSWMNLGLFCLHSVWKTSTYNFIPLFFHVGLLVALGNKHAISKTSQWIWFHISREILNFLTLQFSKGFKEGPSGTQNKSLNKQLKAESVPNNNDWKWFLKHHLKNLKI